MVSWPASTSVSSSSRSSRSVSGSPSSVRAAHDQREDVGPLLEVGRPAPVGDDGVGEAVEDRDPLADEAHRLGLSDVHQEAGLRDWESRESRQLLDGGAQAALGRSTRRLALDPEDARHDHVERDRLHARGERERAAQRPAVDLPLGDVRDHLRVALDRLAVERRQQQLALAQVARADRRQHRVRPDDRPQRRLAGERWGLLGAGGEQRAHMFGVPGDDRPAGDDAGDAEDLAELAAPAEHELDLALAEVEDLAPAGEGHRRRRREPSVLAARRTGG